MKRKQLPDDPHPETEDRFNRLLRSMVKPVFETREEESQTLDEATDEDCDDTQTLTDTSEGAS